MTAIVAEVPGHVARIDPVPAEALQNQISGVMSTFPIAAGKTGMLGTRANVEVIAGILDESPDFPLVVDPVFRASAGAELLPADGVEALKNSILPRAHLVTPNLAETEVLLGYRIGNEDDLKAAPCRLYEKYGSSFLVKGGHFHSSDTDVIDYWYISGSEGEYRHPRLAIPDTHGTGCTLSAAIAVHIARGLSLDECIVRSTEYLATTLSSRFEWDTASGKIGALNHFPNDVDCSNS